MNELIKIEDGNAILDAETSEKMVALNKAIKSLKEQDEELRKAIMEEMEKKDIVKIDDEVHGLTISYIDEHDRETFDSNAFRKKHPDLYDEYINISAVKASVKVVVK